MYEDQLSRPGPENGLTPSGKTTQGFGVVTSEKSSELASVAVAAAAKAEVEAAYVMALKRPRSEETARIKILNICKDPIFAEKAKYRKPIGGGHIVGPSIRLAEELLRNWGNVLVQQSAIYEDNMKRLVKVVVRDLESNLSFSTEITVEKHVERRNTKGREVIGERINTSGQKVGIVKATEDELMVKEAALASKAIRNNGLRLIPEHIIEGAIRQIDTTMKDKINRNPDEEIMRIASAFAEVRVYPEDLEKYLGHPIKQSVPAEIADLREIYTAIKDGQSKWADFTTPKKEARKEAATGMLDRLSAGDPRTHTAPDAEQGKAGK